MEGHGGGEVLDLLREGVGRVNRRIPILMVRFWRST
jgi:hypothetical protein